MAALYARTVLLDTSAVIALLGTAERFHLDARRFFSESPLSWCALRVTSHETFSTVRKASYLARALEHYDFYLSYGIEMLDFGPDDEIRARGLLESKEDKALSFHDALCAAVMQREHLYRIFSFDSDFLCFDFEVLPGIFK
jgi:predicted nucleic acid-binding protein